MTLSIWIFTTNMSQGRSEETAELLSEKAKVAEEEAVLLNIKVSKAENEIHRYKTEIVKVIFA